MPTMLTLRLSLLLALTDARSLGDLDAAGAASRATGKSLEEGGGVPHSTLADVSSLDRQALVNGERSPRLQHGIRSEAPERRRGPGFAVRKRRRVSFDAEIDRAAPAGGTTGCAAQAATTKVEVKHE